MSSSTKRPIPPSSPKIARGMGVGSRECTYFLIGGCNPACVGDLACFRAKGRGGRTRSRRRRRPGSPPQRRWPPIPSSSGALSGPLYPYAAQKVVAASCQRDSIALPRKRSCSLPRLERVGNRLGGGPRLLTERRQLERGPGATPRTPRALDRLRRDFGADEP